MIKVSVLYPNATNSRFDIAYYCDSHMKMVADRLGAALRKIEVDHGISGPMPDAPAPFVAMGHLYFDSIETFQAAFAPHVAEFMADVTNYTDIEPVIQVSALRG